MWNIPNLIDNLSGQHLITTCTSTLLYTPNNWVAHANVSWLQMLPWPNRKGNAKLYCIGLPKILCKMSKKDIISRKKLKFSNSARRSASRPFKLKIQSAKPRGNRFFTMKVGFLKTSFQVQNWSQRLKNQCSEPMARPSHACRFFIMGSAMPRPWGDF